MHILSQDGGTGGIDAGNAVDGKWHHLLLSWKQGAANGFRSYLDGQLVASRDAADAPIPAHNAALYFGAFNGVGEFTNGELDEIAVWTKSMTDEEVASNWYKKLSGNEDGLAGYWDFDDDTADDRSGNEHHGTFLGDSITIESNIPGLDAYFATTLTEPGAFKLDNLPNGNGYEVDAFMDVNGNGRVDKGEPSGAFSGNPITVSGDHIDVDFTLIELPSITSNPEDIRVAAGEDITLAIMVSGSQPMTFEWRKNGVLIQDSGSISGTDSAVLLISGAKGSDSGTYNCVVSNAAGETTSPTSLVQVIEDGLNISGSIQYDGVQQGEVIVTATQIQEGNKVLALDGDGDHAVTTLTDLSGTELSIQYWFRGSSIQSAVRQQSSGYIVAGWSGTHILSIDGGTSGVSAGESATDGNWHHLIMTWKQDSPGGFSTYLDGRLVGQRDSASGEIPNLQAQVYFGAFNGVGEFMNGQLDEIAILEKALSESEIAVGWNSPLTGTEEGLLGFWNFDDGSGTDLSTYGNHADLHGDAVIVEEIVAGLGGGVFNASFESTGPFTLSNILPGSNYAITAFLDVNGNGAPDVGEPSGVYEGNPFDLNDHVTDINITLTEPPVISRQVLDVRVATGGTARLSVQAQGTEPFSYQWQKDGLNLQNGPNAPELMISNANNQDEGAYSVIVSNLKGEASSRAGSLDVVADGAEISGNITYSGNPSGKIHVTAASFLPGNQALTLDGNGDFVIVPDLTDLSGFELTIQYWFRGESIQSAVRQQSGGYIVAGWNGLHILSDDGGTGAGVNAGPNVTDGQWHHLLMTWEGGAPDGFRSYVDGKLVEQRDAADTEIGWLDAPVYFGSFNGQSEFMNGQLDEIAIWERTLTGDEVAAMWNMPLDGSEQGLLGLWKFDDGTASDATPNQYDGALNGDAVIQPSNIPGFGGDVSKDVLDGAGLFTMTNVPKGSNYHVWAFVDVNGNFLQDEDEPRSESNTNPFDLNGDVADIELDLGGVIGEVRISFSVSGASLIISWPIELSGQTLYQTPSLTNPNWTQVNGVVDNQAVISLDQSSSFFQLR